MTEQHPDITALGKLKPRIPRARRCIIDNIPGYPSGSGAAGGTGDRTTNLALKGGAHDDKQRDKPSQVGAMHTDRALRDLHQLDRLQPAVLEWAHTQGATITRQVSQLKRIIDRWDLSPAAADNIRATADDGKPGCRSCARVGKWSDVHSNQLCHWCIRITPRVAALYEWDEDEPPVKLVAWHHDTGKNVKDSTIHSVMLGQRRRADSVDAVP